MRRQWLIDTVTATKRALESPRATRCDRTLSLRTTLVEGGGGLPGTTPTVPRAPVHRAGSPCGDVARCCRSGTPGCAGVRWSPLGHAASTPIYPGHVTIHPRHCGRIKSEPWSLASGMHIVRGWVRPRQCDPPPHAIGCMSPPYAQRCYRFVALTSSLCPLQGAHVRLQLLRQCCVHY